MSDERGAGSGPPSRRRDLGFREVLEAVEPDPHRLIPYPSVETALAFVRGLELRDGQDPLAGFQPWLVDRLGGGDNVTWAGLARLVVRPGEPLPRAPGPDEDAKARAVIQLVLEYLRQADVDTN